MILGDIFGTKFQLGADSKIYGNVDASKGCSLRAKSHIAGNLRYSEPCNSEIGATAASTKQVSPEKPTLATPTFAFSDSAKAVNISKSETLLPGEYGALNAKKRAKIKLSSGSYKFQSIHTDPNVELSFDLTSGPITIDVANDVDFGNKSQFAINGGNPSEITWNIAGKSIKIGNDGLYFGTIIAPNASVSIESRTHLVGSVYVNKLTIAPKSTISREPRAEEISHSEGHFGPFFESNTFHYRSVLPTTAKSVEMYVYAKDSKVKVNGKQSTKVALDASSTIVKIEISRDKITGFPAEAFSSNYVFSFEKNDNYRIYWNPQSPCSQGCEGTTPATAIGDFNAVLETAQKTGREINITSGTWNVADNFSDGVVPWKVGFELVGYTGDIWHLKSENDMPLIDLGKSSHIEIQGRSPRSLKGLRIANGFNAKDGGAIHASNQKLTIKNAVITDSKSNAEGGAIFATDSLNLENIRFSGNSALGDGGAVAANGETKMLNIVYTGNKSAKNGGAVKLTGNGTYIGNAVFHDNRTVIKGGAINNESNKLDIWNSTFFANIAKAANPAISGKANGSIGNSIFWKNFTPSCEPGKCANEVIEGFSATHSSFSRPYGGNHNYTGDPKFMDEKNPAGNSAFMDFDAGVNLSDESPLRKAGKIDELIPKTDITGSERSKKETSLGAYAYSTIASEFFYGNLQEDGTIGIATPTFPLFDTIPSPWFRSYLADSKLARAIKVKISKHPKTETNSLKIRFSLTKKDKTPYNIKPVDILFFKSGEEDGKYVFQTMTETQGKPVLFTRNKKNIGNFEEAIVLFINDGSDRFHYQILDFNK
ncbi:hypothetical protein [Fibrobacter sp. UWB11]|uniref:hypothetical protein n=1 Tax=Fibrobacter sp. UWB11 TaxID=1896202 RepID=UPI001587FB07|nr:hypothetical protein [Fibrobacter sp. UWB11]